MQRQKRKEEWAAQKEINNHWEEGEKDSPSIDKR